MADTTGFFKGSNSDWLRITQNAVRDGEQYFNAGIRREIEQDVRQFQGQHPITSKYLSDAYKARSKFFAPKTRATIRRNEAVAASAFFSNTDVTEVSPWDDSDKTQQAGAALMKEWLNLRLRRTLPWFQLSIGAYQEAQAVGLVCAHATWKTDEKKGIDEPEISLIPIENIVVSPASSWIDVVNTSPYFIHKIPMYVKDVQARMKDRPEKGERSKWFELPAERILTSVRAYSDSIRLARERDRADSQSQANSLMPYQIVWVYRNIADVDGEDYIWYTLGESDLLSKGEPLIKAYWHGLRPYVMGYCVIEAHKIYPPGVSRLTRDLQAELNENRNQRSDNVKFAMNKRYFAKRGAQVDIRSLTRNIPSSVTLMNNPTEDVHVVETKDVTASAFHEQDRLNADFDELAGSFSPAQQRDQSDLANKVGGAELLTEDKNQIEGYQLRTYTETFIEPLMYQLMRLGQHYETDEDILKLCGQKANLEHFGVTNIDDALIMQDLSLSIHVGIGATSPRKQLDNLLFGLSQLKDILEGGTMMQLGLDIEEIATEIFGKLGYKSADRFFKWDEEDPRIIMLQNQVKDLTDAVKSKKDPPEIIAAKVQLLQSQVKKTLADAFNVNVEGLFGSMQAAEVVAAIPAVAPVADTISKAAGYEVPSPPGVDPGVVAGGSAPPGPGPQDGAPQSAPAPADQTPPQGVAPPSGGPAPPPSTASGPAPGVTFAPHGVMNNKTGVGFSPSAIGGGGKVEPGLPAGVPHNTHPGFPAHTTSAAAGAHAGIEGGQHAELLSKLNDTMTQLHQHMSKPKPALNIKRDERGNMTRIEPEER